VSGRLASEECGSRCLLVLLAALGLALVACSRAAPGLSDGAAAPAAGRAAAKPAAPAAPPAAEQPAAESTDRFYAGKTVRVIVGFSAGGNYDIWARVLARYMPKYLPGNPTMVVENMTGAGSLIAANYLYNAAPRDGTVFGTFGNGNLLAQIVDAPGVEYDVRRFHWLGAPINGTYTCIATEASGVRRLEDLLPPRRQQVILGTSGPGSASHDYGMLLIGLLDANIRLISGYPGNNEIRLAVQRGEVDSYCLVWDSAKVQHRPWVEAGNPKFDYIVQFGLQKHPELPQVTNAYELLGSEDDRALMRLLIVPDQFFYPFATPPGIPPERVALLRRAMAQAFDDAELNDEVQKSGLEKNPQTGEHIEQLVNDLLGTPDAVRSRFKQLSGR
jgi:tripartite-type tricarboxylate transporter receptor subunit TctC